MESTYGTPRFLQPQKQWENSVELHRLVELLTPTYQILPQPATSEALLLHKEVSIPEPCEREINRCAWEYVSRTPLALFTRQGGLREGVHEQPNAQEQEEKVAQRTDPTWLGFAKRSQVSVDQNTPQRHRDRPILTCRTGKGRTNVCIQ